MELIFHSTRDRSRSDGSPVGPRQIVGRESTARLVMEPFSPHPLLWGPHAQTLAAHLRSRGDSTGPGLGTNQHFVDLGDGDRLVLHDDLPPGWKPGDPATLLVHGLGGCHASPYMIRISKKLRGMGWRVVRMDMRGCGAGLALATRSYHAGRTKDLRRAVECVAALCPDSILTVVGFSLGGSIVLRWLGEEGPLARRFIVGAMAISPPVDLALAARIMQSGLGRVYDRYFANLLWRQLVRRRNYIPREHWPRGGRPRTLAEFDARYTVVQGEFASREDYYEKASAKAVLHQIHVPTTVITSVDDPITAPYAWRDVPSSPELSLWMTERGGHLGFLERRRGATDGYWVDRQILHWLLHWQVREGRRPTVWRPSGDDPL